MQGLVPPSVVERSVVTIISSDAWGSHRLVYASEQCVHGAVLEASLGNKDTDSSCADGFAAACADRWTGAELSKPPAGSGRVGGILGSMNALGVPITLRRHIGAANCRAKRTVQHQQNTRAIKSPGLEEQALKSSSNRWRALCMVLLNGSSLAL